MLWKNCVLPPQERQPPLGCHAVVRKDEPPARIVGAPPTRIAHGGSALQQVVANQVRPGSIGNYCPTALSFTICGVAPVGHPAAPATLIDSEQVRFDMIWATPGRRNGVFKLTPQQRAELTGAPVEDITP